MVQASAGSGAGRGRGDIGGADGNAAVHSIVERFDEHHAAFRRDLSLLVAENAELRNRVGELEGRLAVTETRSAELGEDVRHLTADNQRLASANQRLASANAALKKRVRQLELKQKEQEEKHSAEMSRLQKQIEAVSASQQAGTQHRQALETAVRRTASLSFEPVEQAALHAAKLAASNIPLQCACWGKLAPLLRFWFSAVTLITFLPRPPPQP